MKKILVLFVTCFLVTGNCSPATAQVAIGGDGSVATGAVLDLSQQGAATGGLLLPQVVLTAENANPFGEGGSETLPSGLLVYNLGSETEGEALDEGLYVLKGGLWVQAGSGGSTHLMNVAITPNTPVALYTTGGTQQLNPAISIADSTTIIWTSSNTDVAVVSDKGVVSPVADGEAEITVSFGGITSDPVAVTVTTPICGSSFTAPSGKVYNTANYSNANLTNLCWTTSNLQEAGYSATCYSNNCGTYPTRGYYYTVGANADNACAALNSGGGSAWRVPTGTEWAALQTAFPSLAAGTGTTGNTATLQADWNRGADMAGWHHTPSDWSNWGGHGDWWVQGTSGLTYYVFSGGTTMSSITYPNAWLTVRCVRSL